jgi:hypothetical protein
MGECGDGMTLHRYAMLVDFVVEGFAEGEGVSGAILGSGSLTVVRSKPKMEAIKKMKTRRINQRISVGVILGAEEDGRREDSLKSLNNSPIMATIGSEAEEIEHLKGSFKVDGAAFLLDGESGYPNGDQAILAEGDGRFIMHLPQYRLGILCLFGVYLSCAPGLGVSVRLTHSA